MGQHGREAQWRHTHPVSIQLSCIDFTIAKEGERELPDFIKQVCVAEGRREALMRLRIAGAVGYLNARRTIFRLSQFLTPSWSALVDQRIDCRFPARKFSLPKFSKYSLN